VPGITTELGVGFASAAAVVNCVIEEHRKSVIEEHHKMVVELAVYYRHHGFKVWSSCYTQPKNRKSTD
jgi:hypothetical protein